MFHIDKATRKIIGFMFQYSGFLGRRREQNTFWTEYNLKTKRYIVCTFKKQMKKWM